MENVQRILEVERVTNLVKGFGWDKKDEAVDGNVIRISFEKTVEPPQAAGVFETPSE